jgi:LacI family transcriptional regulator
MLDSMGEQWPSDIKIVGFDLLPPNLHYLRKNKISFLINQNPEQQGYQGLINIYNYLVLKKNVEPLQYLPLDIVVTENVQYYINQELEAREKIDG